MKEISEILGVPVDHYIKVNLKGFIALVDYMGGVDFDVPCDMSYDDPYQNLSIHFKKGMQHLNGQQAMEVARFRKNNDGSGYTDVGRTQAQQDILVALAKKALAWNSLTKLNGFVDIFNKYVDTDLSTTEMLYFASQAIHIDPSSDVETCTLQGNGEAHYRGYSYCYALDPTSTLGGGEPPGEPLYPRPDPGGHEPAPGQLKIYPPHGFPHAAGPGFVTFLVTSVENFWPAWSASTFFVGKRGDFFHRWLFLFASGYSIIYQLNLSAKVGDAR